MITATLRREEKSMKSADDFVVVVDRKDSTPDLLVVGAKKGSRTSGGGKIGVPPPLQCTPTYRHVYRFLAASGTSARNVTSKALVGVAGAVCSVANTTAAYIATSVKLHRITIYPGVSTTGAVAPGINWGATTSFSRDEKINRSVPQGITMSMATTFKPPKESGMAFWMTSSSNVICAITCPSGSIIDVELTAALSNTFTQDTATIATGTLGILYYLPLDGTSTHEMLAVGLPGTF